MIRAIGPNGPELLNVRLVGSVMVLDHLISHGVELRLGSGPQAETVRITRQAPRTIACPGNAACPVWPAQRYAAR
jgi:hypothetical protein